MSTSNSSMVIDAVDASNRPVGRVKRGDVFAEKKNFRTVHVLIRSLDRKSLLLQQLRADHIRSPSRLGSSVAGYVQAGETYRQAAIRKIREELQIPRVRIIYPVCMVKMRDTGVLKFVQVFAFSYNYEGNFDDSQIEKMLYYPFATIDIMLEQEPERFTETFKHVYRSFRAVPKWTSARER